MKNFWSFYKALSRIILFLCTALFVSMVGTGNATALTLERPTNIINQEPITLSLLNDQLLAQQVEELATPGECRAVNRTVDIFSEPSVGPSSIVRRTLLENQTVTLAGEGNNGWIQVSAPDNGYVIARYLKYCAGNPPPPGNCRRVVAPAGGLIVRSQPTTTSSQVGSVYVGNVLRVTGQTSTDSTGRRWVEITSPVRGWVSSGFPEGNLSDPFNCS
jgi:hypothetical protein